jgi:Xaa-Pro aminopeptidase
MKSRNCWRALRGCVLTAVGMATAFASPVLRAEGVEQGRWIEAPGAVLSHRQRIEPVNRALEERLTELLPRLMREVGLDMWVVINREYAEDPVYLTLVPEPVFAARRTTMLVFYDRGDEGLERLTVSRYPLGGLYDAVWEGGDLDEQWERLGEVIAERDPQRIGIDVSRHWPVADGLTASLRDRLEESLGPDLSRRLVSAEDLAIRWLETRSPVEQESYPHIVALARGVIAEAFSNRVITPGVTTTEDVAWYIRQRFADLDLAAWFMPDVDIQREGTECEEGSPFCGDTHVVIQRGDILHTDVGICYLRLCTDTQEMGYVLRQGEAEVPAELRSALEAGNHWQDLLTGQFQEGRTGNELLEAARAAADEAGIVVSIYSHPIGFFGHAPGPTIGMWDNQGETPIRGDWELYADTAYAIEGNNMVQLSAWDGQWVQIKLEQSALFDGKQVHYLAGRQTAWHVVR